MTEECAGFQAMIDANDQPVFALDRELRYTAFNRAHAMVMRELYGAEITLGGRLTDYQTVAVDRESATASLERALAGEHVVVSAFSGEEGQRRHFDVAHTPQTDATGTVVGVVVSSHDTTALRAAEAVLLESETKYRIIADNACDWEWWLAPDGSYNYVSPACERITGRTAEEFLADPKLLLAITHPDDVAALEAHMEAEAGCVPAGHHFDFRIYTTDGEERALEHSCREVTGADGTFLGRRGCNHDITERRQAEKALRESEGFLRGLFDNMPSGAAIYEVRGDGSRGSDYIVKDFNATSLRIEGKTKDEVVGKSLVDLRPAIDEYGIIQLFQRVWQTGAPGFLPAALYVDEHYSNWYENHVFRLPSGEIVALYEDVTDHVKAAERLRGSEASMRTLVDTLPDLVWLKDPEGVYLLCNRRFERFFGAKEEDIVGKTDYDFVDKDRADFFRQHDKAAIAAGGPTMNEEELVFADDGHTEILETIKTRIHDSDGRIVGVLGVGRDITHRKQIAEGVRRQADQLRRTAEGAVLAMGNVVETRDPYTAGHERRTAQLATAIAAEMGMEGEELEALRRAGLIHDIGKIAVPTEILTKPGRLSEIEFNIIKQHPESGYGILGVIDFGRPVAEMVRQHHERLDGSGYPRGLTAKDILWEAKILAVADVIEAMSSHRPYRPALGMEPALDELRKHAGVKYDADIVAACARLVEEQGFQFVQ